MHGSGRSGTQSFFYKYFDIFFVLPFTRSDAHFRMPGTPDFSSQVR